MLTADTPLVVLITAPTLDVATRLARGLVEARLAACVNILPGITSIYRWQGAVESAAEQLLVAKCPADGYDALEAWVLEHHPYDTPECIALPIVAGSPAYLQWLATRGGAE